MTQKSKKSTIHKQQCPKCGYKWEARLAVVKSCPYCKQYFKIESLEKR